MPKYTDDDIRGMGKVTCQVAAQYLGISNMAVSMGMRNNLLPIGFAVHNEDKYRDSWSYNIIGERLIAYKYGRINEVQLDSVDKSLRTIAEEFDKLRQDLLFVLSEDAAVKS